MEALELFRDEHRKMEEHKYVCEAAGKQVATPPRGQARPALMLWCLAARPDRQNSQF